MKRKLMALLLVALLLVIPMHELLAVDHYSDTTDRNVDIVIEPSVEYAVDTHLCCGIVVDNKDYTCCDKDAFDCAYLEIDVTTTVPGFRCVFLGCVLGDMEQQTIQNTLGRCWTILFTRRCLECGDTRVISETLGPAHTSVLRHTPLGTTSAWCYQLLITRECSLCGIVHERIGITNGPAHSWGICPTTRVTHCTRCGMRG